MRLNLSLLTRYRVQVKSEALRLQRRVSITYRYRYPLETFRLGAYRGVTLAEEVSKETPRIGDMVYTAKNTMINLPDSPLSISKRVKEVVTTRWESNSKGGNGRI